MKGVGARESVIRGLARVSKIVLAAGAIMTAVFLGFATDPEVIVKILGIGLGVAIMIDVLIVRMLVAPAVTTLLGDQAWWLPGWLDRLLPRLDLERPEKKSGSPEADRGRAPVPAGRPTPADAREG
jgi:putative drug exporter of the RND superfamily